MSRENVAVVRGIYEAFGRGDPQAVLAYLHPEVEVYQSERLPWGGRYEGPEGVAEFLGKLAQAVEANVDPDELVDDGAGHVVAVGHTRGRVRKTGRDFEARAVHVWALKDGKAASFEAYADATKLLEALEP